MENSILLSILRNKGILNDKDIHEIQGTHTESSYFDSIEEKQDRFNEKSAKEIVSKMYHTENGKKYIGEKYNTQQAKDIHDRYRSVIPQTVTCYDVYVALNEHYHNYCLLFKSWFGESIDIKIIESAIVYWFRDEDWKDGCKIWKHFN